MNKDDAQKATCIAVKQLSLVELERIRQLINLFGKREKRPLYLDGLPKSTEHVGVNFLRLDSEACTITRDTDATSFGESRSFQRLFDELHVRRTDEHNAVDLYLTACELIPRFRQTCNKNSFAASPVVTAKPAVAPIEYDGSEPPLVFDSPLFNSPSIKPSQFCNALGIGSTGSGKTASFIQPVLFSLLAYRGSSDKTVSMLVIDPKVELLKGIVKTLHKQGESDRLVVMGKCSPVSFFSDNDGLSLTDRFEKVKAFTSNSSGNADDSRWQSFADSLVLSMLRDDQLYADVTGLALLENITTLVTKDIQYLKRGQWMCLRKLLMLGMESQDTLRLISDVYDLFMVTAGISKMERPISRYVAMKEMDQWFYNARGALTVADILGSEDVETIIDMGVRKGLVRGDRTDIASLIDRGYIVVFQPRQSKTHDMMGRALKSLFFRAVMERQDMLRPVAYVVDEFQRYISDDEESGDHAFLDRCRAYRCNAVLASQSMAALLTTLGQGHTGRSALDSLLVNTPTKICFRTTDTETVSIMKSFIPLDSYSGQHILSVRPPSSMKTGEYYFSIGHEWGRAQYKLPMH